MLRFVILIISLIDFVEPELKGESCTVGVPGQKQNGICTYTSDCPIVAEWAKVLIRPHICTYEKTKPVVCCPVNNLKTTTTKPVTEQATQTIGDPCSIKVDNSQGRCTYSSSCSIVETWSKVGIFPDICFYENLTPIICCPVTHTTTANAQTTESTVRPTPMFYTSSTEASLEDDIGELVNIRKCRDYYQETRKFFGRSTCANGVALIVGGNEADLGRYPHMAALGYQKDNTIKWLCGGTLISDRWVITAGHCVNTDPYPNIIRLGDLDLQSDNDGAEPVDFLITQTKIHKELLPPAKYNDIALLKTNKRVIFSQFIRPACLWNEPYEPSKLIATGWGETSFASELSPDLREVSLDVLPNDQCQYFWKSPDLSNGITSNMLCTFTPNKDTCFGDSGGPLVTVNENNSCVFNIIGVTSFGKSCGGRRAPGVYTRISSYIDWIEFIVWP